MTETVPFTIEQFYKFIGEKKLMASKCNKCGVMSLPPKPICSNCLSTDSRWIRLRNRGKLLTYTIIYIAPERFQSMAPYAFGIVELDYGLRLPGMIRGIENEKINVGMELEIDFDINCSQTWPQWPRYFFRPP
ncbi:MAG: Zn-ribbon domain-containing OB-fold protein [Candidatus Bathyarchaeia archaeon]